jgi:SAM-dependent methyltransferase
MIETPFPEHAFSYLAAAEDRHWWFRSRNKMILWALLTKVRPFAKYLEIGCGTGYVLQAVVRQFPSVHLSASEYYEAGLVHARKRVPNCSFSTMDATKMTDHLVYDCIGCFDVIEHIEADQRVLNNFFRALRPGGSIVLTVPQHPWLWSQADAFAHHQRRYTAADLQRKLKLAGFSRTYYGSFVSLLLPVMIVQRFLARKRPYSPDQEFKISRALNSFLLSIMRIELLLIRLGVRFPVGGSLLIVAQKP